MDPMKRYDLGLMINLWAGCARDLEVRLEVFFGPPSDVAQRLSNGLSLNLQRNWGDSLIRSLRSLTYHYMVP